MPPCSPGQGVRLTGGSTLGKPRPEYRRTAIIGTACSPSVPTTLKGATDDGKCQGVAQSRRSPEVALQDGGMIVLSQLGSLGGKARARSLTPEALSKIGRDAARKRWRAAKKRQA